MKRGWGSLLRVSQSVRIAVSVVLIVVLLGTFSVVLGVARQNEAARQDRLNQLMQSFLSVQEKTDEQLFALMQLSSSVHDNPQLRKVALREHSVIDLLNAQDELNKLLAFNPLLNGVYYYIRDAERLIARDGVYDFSENEWYFESFEAADAEEMQAILAGRADEDGLYLLPAMSRVNSVGPVIVAALPVPYHSVSAFATILVEIRQDKLLKLILPAPTDNQVIYRFCRGDGVVLFSNDSRLLEADGGRSADGFELFVSDGESYCRLRAERVGKAKLTYELYMPQAMLDAGLLSRGQMRFLIACFVLLLALSCTMLYLWMYQPMRLLTGKLGGEPAAKRLLPGDDYAIVIHEIEQLRASNNLLLWKLDSNMDSVRASLLRQLIEYGQPSDSLLELCQRADLVFEYTCFRLMLIASQRDGAGMAGEFVKLSGHGADIYAVRMPDMLYVLVNAGEEARPSTHQVVDRLSAAGITAPGDQLYFARSEWVSRLSELHLYYRRTLETLSQRIFHGATGWNAETDAAPEPARRQYPINEMMLLREGIMDWDMARIEAAMMELQRYLLHEQTRNTVAVLAAGDALQMLQQYTEADLSPLLLRVRRKGSTAVDVCQVLTESLRVIEQATSRREEDTLTEAMMLYISEMLESPALSNQTVAEHFHMSESAFSHAFKKRTGSTFVKYVTDLKIQRAKSLLICTEQSVEAIADRLNYASASSFARMFKAETSLTPTQYRRLRESAESV